MLSRIRDRNIWIVYVTIFLLGVAYGASLSVTPLQLELAHFGKRQIGTLAAWFAAGLVLASLPAGAIIRRLTARGAILLCLAGYTVSVVAFPFQTTYAGAAAVRALDGASSVGVWVACETVLLARSDAENKAFVMSLYGMAIAIGYVVGSGLARAIAHVATYRDVFLAAGAIAVVAGLLVLVRLDPTAHRGGDAEAAGEGEATTPLSTLLWRIKTSCLATFSYGYFQASVVLFLPLYLVHDKGIPANDTILITAFFAGGMLIFSSVVGRVGDAIGHLRTMTVLAVIGVTMIFGFVWLRSWVLMRAAIFVAGATLASISPLSLALQGHISEPRDYGRANGLYNASYAIGMLLGPPMSSLLFEGPGGGAMLLHLAALWTAFVAASIVFRRDDPSWARR